MATSLPIYECDTLVMNLNQRDSTVIHEYDVVKHHETCLSCTDIDLQLERP